MELHEMTSANPDFVDPETGKSFVLPRTRTSIERHIAGGHHAINVYSEAPEYKGMAIAQILIALPDLEGASNLEGYPIRDKKRTAVIQAFAVHPDHKKCGIEALFAAIEMVARSEGRTHIMAKMNAKNKKSIEMFGYMGNPRARYRQVGHAVKVPGQTYESVFMEKVLDAPEQVLQTIQQPRKKHQSGTKPSFS